jgi:hypothetical protein
MPRRVMARERAAARDVFRLFALRFRAGRSRSALAFIRRRAISRYRANEDTWAPVSIEVDARAEGGESSSNSAGLCFVCSAQLVVRAIIIFSLPPCSLLDEVTVVDVLKVSLAKAIARR